MTGKFIQQFERKNAIVNINTSDGIKSLAVVFRLPKDPNTQSYLRMIQTIPEMSPTEILLEVIEAWEFDESLNSANMNKLIDNCPQAAFAIMEAFGSLIHSREIQQIWGQKWLM
ncbi:TPA: hypothetical protein SMR96_003200 [Proteus mirabilis]|uniref:phage tail assembly chaperone n=1 Tax=Proteus mirabilis TaxID=584 RepID=UPI0013D08ED5|nr:phage tail assembly chaperone [Proteus mirabilis]MBG3047513.1 hypothetical protein [Proteus mirabilis]MBG6019242.1 hypothetical protein [Proteus mirabilis]MDL2091071.1 phage tail assembly chaperone [Proteus mirabilis]MDL2105355.1 phage tail assembly chaperone [Proteus mirabilis]HEJ9538785.1 hypothetical protein [Proteus mirabilis]